MIVLLEMELESFKYREVLCSMLGTLPRLSVIRALVFKPFTSATKKLVRLRALQVGTDVWSEIPQQMRSGAVVNKLESCIITTRERTSNSEESGI